MYCKKCGNKLNEGDEFCSSCGSKILIVTSDKEMKAIEIQPKDIQRTQETKRKNPGILIGLLIGIGSILILCLILTVTGIISIGRNAEKQQFSIEESDSEDMPEDEDSFYALKTEGKGYESGEEALGAYLHFLQNQDVDGMISCFSVETFCEKVDIKKYAERRGFYQPYSDSVMPIFGDFSKDIFVKKRIAEISRGIYCQYMTLVAPGYVNGEKAGIFINLADYDRNVDEMFEQLYEYTDDEQFKKDFSFEGRFVDPYLLTNYVHSDENNAKYLEGNRNIYGAQNYESVVAEFEFGGKTYLMCADVIEYGEKWYLYSLGGNVGVLLGIDAYHSGIVEKEYAGESNMYEETAPAAKRVEAEPATGQKFIMGIDAEYPPFSYMGDDGEYTGFDVDVCKAACEKLGWNFEVFGVNWDEKLIQLDAGECDCVWSGMTILDSMEEAGYVISEPYYDEGAEQYGIVFRAGEQDKCDAIVDAVKELVADGTYAKIAENYPDIVSNLVYLQ